MTVSKNRFAEMTGLSRRTLNRWLDGELREVLVGGQVDEQHPLSRWLITTGGKGSPPGEGREELPPGRVGAPRGLRRPPAASPLAPPQGRRPPRGAPPAHPGATEARPAPAPATTAGERLCHRPEAPQPPRQAEVGRVARGERMDRFVSPDTVPLPDGSLLTIEEIRDLPFGEVVDRWGWGPAFKEHLLALRALEEARDKRLRVDERRGSLISREFVRTHVIGYVDGLSQKLLSEFPRRLTGLLRAAPTPEEAESIALHEFERVVRTTKAQVAASMAKTGTATVPQLPDEDVE